MSELKYHEVANIFPLMQGEEYEALKQDIAENGLREAIWLHPDGSIIDGRNRYRACMDTGTEPVFRTWNGDGSLVAFVVSLNLHRRHLTSGQKAMIAVEMLPLLEEEARQRKIRAAVETNVKLGRLSSKSNPDRLENLLITEGIDVFICPVCQDVFDVPVWHCQHCNHHWQMHRDVCHNCYEKRPETLDKNFYQASPERRPQSIDTAAAILGTNRQYASDAKRIAQEAPDLAAQVKSGEITIVQAKREIIARHRREAPQLPNDKYRVIYADPPWKYGNTMPDYFFEQADHYSLMTTKEVAGMPVESLAEDDAVLFLWVTSPILEESFQVINSWGFKYKASFVWDKIKHNMGHYNSVRHEFLLVAVRGSCQPDVQKLFDSVVGIERTEHSTKPEKFREIIDTIYPYGRRIELFARRQVDKWDVWGNEFERTTATV